MTFVNKTSVALRLLVAGLMLVLVGCATESNLVHDEVEMGGAYFKRFPPCNTTGQYSTCEIKKLTYSFVESSPEHGLIQTTHSEIGPHGAKNGLDVWYIRLASDTAVADEEKHTRCWNDNNLVAQFVGTGSPHNTASSPEEVERICEPIRLAMEQETAETIVVSAEQRLDACDSFGFERGTEAHAECAMKLYMNEQNQGTAKAVTSSNTQQTPALARQQAIQEATLKEQKRIQELEASLRVMQFGIDLMNGTTSSPTPSKTHSQSYSINGQIIRCTTTGSITTCL